MPQLNDAGWERDAPKVPVPVSEEDFAKRRQRTRLAIAGAMIAALLAAGYLYKRTTDPVRARESLDAAERLYRIGRYTQAILSLDAAIAYQPSLAEAFLLRGRARMDIFDVDKALADFTRAVALRPTEAQPYFRRGLAYFELRNYQAALADSDQAIQRDPRLAEAHNLKGTVMRAMGKPKEALVHFDRAVELQPNLDNYFQRGATRQVLGDHQRAIADFDRAVAFSPRSAQPYYARAESKRAIGDVKGAAQDHHQGRVFDRR
jgi:tetratricopeptide (TPR) repeat protein